MLSSLWVSRTGSASDWCALQEALYKCIDTIEMTKGPRPRPTQWVPKIDNETSEEPVTTSNLVSRPYDSDAYMYLVFIYMQMMYVSLCALCLHANMCI